MYIYMSRYWYYMYVLLCVLIMLLLYVYYMAIYTVLINAPQSHSKRLFLLVVRCIKLEENSIYTVVYTVVMLA